MAAMASLNVALSGIARQTHATVAAHQAAVGVARDLAEHPAPGAALLCRPTGSVRLAITERDWSLHQRTLVPIPPNLTGSSPIHPPR